MTAKNAVSMNFHNIADANFVATIIRKRIRREKKRK